MAVHQVEQWYLFFKVPASKRLEVKLYLSEMGLDEVTWDGENLTVDDIYCEGEANQIDHYIESIINS